VQFLTERDLQAAWISAQSQSAAYQEWIGSDNDIYDEVFADAYSSGVMTDAAVDFCVVVLLKEEFIAPDEARYHTESWIQAEQEATEAYRQGGLKAYASVDEMMDDIRRCST